MQRSRKEDTIRLQDSIGEEDGEGSAVAETSLTNDRDNHLVKVCNGTVVHTRKPDLMNHRAAPNCTCACIAGTRTARAFAEVGFSEPTRMYKLQYLKLLYVLYYSS